MPTFLLGYRNGSNDYSWSMDGPWSWMPEKPIPLDVRLTKKQLTSEYGVHKIESCDYYIARRFGNA